MARASLPTTRHRLRLSRLCCRSRGAGHRCWGGREHGLSGSSGGGKGCCSPAPANPARQAPEGSPPYLSFAAVAAPRAPSASGIPGVRRRLTPADPPPPPCPCVGRGATPKAPSGVSHPWLGASVTPGCPPRLPVGAASHCVSGLNQIDNDPRLASALL